MEGLTLEVRHPRTGLIRIDSVGEGHLVLVSNGDTSRRPQRLSLTSALALNWNRRPEFELRALPGRASRKQKLEFKRNGFAEDRDVTLRENDRVTWLDFTISVTKMVELEPELIEQAQAARQGDAARAVFADWLEGRGQLELAQWTRAMTQLGSPGRVDLQALARSVTLRERALVSRGPIERCFSECDRPWETLPISESNVCHRTCPQCSMEVDFFETTDRLPHAGPVVICPSAEREPGDIWPEPVVG